MITVKEIAWLAGIIEGEGSIYHINSATIKIGMTDKDIIERVSKLFDVPMYEIKKSSSNYKQAYSVTIHSNKAIQWMFTIYSLMGERRKGKIREVIAIWKLQRFLGNNEIFSCGHLKTISNTYWFKNCKVCATCVKARNDARYKKKKNLT